MINSGNTVLLNDIMLHCDNLEDFKQEIFINLENQKKRWADKISEILDKQKISQADLSRLCEVSKATVLKWVRGSVPKSREMFIRIGFAAGYDLKEMNRFLQRYGRYPELYPKCIEDSVYIFVLNSKIIEHSYASCKSIFSKVEDYIKPENYNNFERIETNLVMEKLLTLKEIDELKSFLKENSSLAKSSFENFYEYVKSFVRKNNNSFIDEVNPNNINILADTLCWSSSLRKCVYSIYRNEWFPLRSKVISLGIHLNMNLDEINEMLLLTKMEPLYILNSLECIVIYALSEAELDEIIYEGTDDLYNYVISIFREMGYDDSEEFFT